LTSRDPVLRELLAADERVTQRARLMRDMAKFKAANEAMRRKIREYMGTDPLGGGR
jgi:hypothetical protein